MTNIQDLLPTDCLLEQRVGKLIDFMQYVWKYKEKSTSKQVGGYDCFGWHVLNCKENDIDINQVSRQISIFIMGATGQTVRLSMFFFLLFTPFSSYMTILTHIYEDAGLPGIGPATLACNYTSFIFSILWAPGLRLGLKTQLLIGGFCYTFNYSSGYFAAMTEIGWLKFIISCTGSFIAGLSAGPLWVSQGRYIHVACQKYGELEKKGQMFGIFSTLYCFSNVFAGLITTFGLGFFDPQAYFLIITIFGIIAFLFCFFFVRQLQKIPSKATQSLMQQSSNQSISNQPQANEYSAKQALKNMLAFFPKMKMLLVLLIIDGISLGFYSSQIPHLIHSNADKNQINKLAGFLLISLGVGATVGGLILGKISDLKSTLFTGRLSLALVVLGSLLFALTVELEYYELALVTAFQWGFFLFFLEGWMYLLCSRHFGGKAEAFAVNKQLHAVFYLIFQLCILPLNNQIPLVPVTIGLAALTIPAFFLLNSIPVDYQIPQRTLGNS